MPRTCQTGKPESLEYRGDCFRRCNMQRVYIGVASNMKSRRWECKQDCI